MEFIAVLWALLGALVQSCRDIIGRYTLKKNLLSEKSILAWQFWMCAIFLSLVYFTAHSFFDASFYNAKLFWWGVFITAFANCFIQLAMVKASKLGEASLTAPVWALTPGLLAFCVYYFGERYTRQGVLGILMIMVCSYIHTRESATTLKEWLLPFTWLIFKPRDYLLLLEEERQKVDNNRSALRWSYLAAALGTWGLIGESFIARHGNIILGAFIVVLFLAVVFSVMPAGTLSAKVHGSGQLPSGAAQFVKWKFLLILGLLVAGNFVFMAMGFRMANIAYVGSLKRLSIIFTVLLAWRFLGEKKAKRRIWPAVGLTIGAMLLALDGTAGQAVNAVQNFLGR